MPALIKNTGLLLLFLLFKKCFTKRILDLLIKGYSYKEIAGSIFYFC